MYYDWKPHVYMKTISRPRPRAVSIAPELISSGGSWAKMPEFASLWWLYCETYAKTQLNDILVICLAIPEKLTHYYGPARLIEFPLCCKPSNVPDQDRAPTFTEATASPKNHPDLKSSPIRI
jgi:hypothetical protein